MAGDRTLDTLDKTVAFLAKRDGTDKVLKLIRYTAKLVLATALDKVESPAARALSRFESSIGTSRKAYKLGKFLADLNKLRKTRVRDQLFLLELLANGGNLIYLFTEQLTWLVKAGVISKRRQAGFSLMSAWAELTGYSGSLTLSGLAVIALLEQEAAVQNQIEHNAKSIQVDSKVGENARLIGQLAALQAKRFMKLLAIVQDLADTVLAMNDIRGGKGKLSNPAVLCSAGLVSAAISAHKNWHAL